MSKTLCVKCGHALHGMGCPEFNDQAAGTPYWKCECAYTHATQHKSTHARMSDILRRSGVEDAEQTIREIEIDRQELLNTLKEARKVCVTWKTFVNETQPKIDTTRTDSIIARIDKALVGEAK